MSFFRQFSHLLATAAIGLAAGLAAVGFQYGSQWIFQWTIVSASKASFFQFALFSMLVVTGGAGITGILISRYAPDAPGSGIPQVTLAYAKKTFSFSWNLIWVKFLGGVLSLGTGSSLGREGPTIHIGAAIANKIALGLKETKEAQAHAICAGAAAGLAAAFNAPLAGVTLVLEEISGGRDIEKYAGRTLLASALAVSMIYLLMGTAAALPIEETIYMRKVGLWLSPIVAIFAGLVGVFFQWATLSLRQLSQNLPLPKAMIPAIGAFIGSLFCIVAFGMTSKLGAFGLGEMDLQATLNYRILWNAGCWLLVAKLFATILCYGSGGCGGIFAPLIFLGGMSGLVMYGILTPFFSLEGQDQILFSLIGMTACLGSVVRAPLTSILIVMEMTYQLYVLPALMVGAVIGAFMNSFFFEHNFYTATLVQDKVREHSLKQQENVL